MPEWLFRQRVDSLGEIKIQFSQSAFAVRGKHQAHFVVTNVDVWVMFLFLRHFGYRVYEIDRVGKIIELKGAFDMVLLQFPLRDFFHPLLVFFFFHPLLELVLFNQLSHNGTTSNIRKSFCNAKSNVSLSQERRASDAGAAGTTVAHNTNFKDQESCEDFFGNRKPP